MLGLKYIARTREPYRPALAAHQWPHHRVLFMTWGDLNSVSYFVDLQHSPQWAMDAVICDNVGDLTRRRGKPRSLYAPADHIDVSGITPASVRAAAQAKIQVT
jgi:hypothetical protein